MTSLRLTICIPSYNRLEAAKNIASLLLKQFNGPDVDLLVIDNASDRPYLEEFSKDPLFVQALADGVLSIVRNSCNIGMSANFMRCFELASGNWLWTLADDDDIRQDALKSILDVIDVLLDGCGFVAFGGELEQSSNNISYIKRLEDFIDYNASSIDVFNRFIFLSNGIYNLSVFRPLLAVGYQYLNTYIPHFMMQIGYMQRGFPAAVVQKKLVDYVVPEIGYSYSMVAGLGVGAPKHALIKTDANHYAKYLSLFFPHNDYKVIIDLHFVCKRDASAYVFRYLAKSYFSYVSDARNFSELLTLRCFLLLTRFPLLFERLLSLGERVNPFFKEQLSEIRRRSL